MSEEQSVNILSIIIPYFFFALWILIPVAIIWGIILFVKKHRKS